MSNLVKNAIYIVATPIGNLADITARAISILQTVDKIAAEDTRHSKQLLNHLGITTKLVALHEHNERDQAQALLSEIQAGAAIALISDAGTPLISDPGYYLVRAAHAQGIKVIPIPGPSAVICALSASGLPTDRFTFEGFLSAKAQARAQQLQRLATEARTMVFYESPHRVLDSLLAMQEAFGVDRNVTMARELTKQFETIFAGSLARLISFVSADTNQQRGEIVLMIEGCSQDQDKFTLNPAAERVLAILLKELSLKQAVSLAVEITGLQKKILYARAIEMQA
jgi:16S rRNA (cytidine1402-2'-O)-methyltransferase